MDLVKDADDTFHNLGDLLTGKTDFNGFKAGEVAIYNRDMAQLPKTAQAFAGAAVQDLEVLASGLVGIGKTVAGPILAASTDEQATLIAQALQAAGVPASGPLSVAEHATLVMMIDGFKAAATSVGLKFATAPAAKVSASNEQAAKSQTPAVLGTAPVDAVHG